MPIILTRIDDRLIHGQVVMKWTKHIAATYIVVADDAASVDFLQKTLMKAATPPDVKSSVLSVKDAAELLKGDKLAREKVFVVIKDPKTVVDLMDLGVQLESVNVGNMRSAEGKKKLSSWIYVTPEDTAAFTELLNRGVKVAGQWLPGEDSLDFNKLLEKN